MNRAAGRLKIPEDVVNEEEHVLTFFVAEVLAVGLYVSIVH
jgi:hypothetical protein